MNRLPRLLVCCLLTWFLWRLLGVLDVTLPLLLYRLLALPAVTGQLGAMSVRVQELTRRYPAEGSHHAFKGHSIEVLEDDTRQPWLRASDVRKVLPDLPRDAVLRQRLGAGAATRRDASGLWLRAQDLADSLAASQAMQTIRFRHWIERDIVCPARRRLELRR